MGVIMEAGGSAGFRSTFFNVLTNSHTLSGGNFMFCFPLRKSSSFPSVLVFDAHQANVVIEKEYRQNKATKSENTNFYRSS